MRRVSARRWPLAWPGGGPCWRSPAATPTTCPAPGPATVDVDTPSCASSRQEAGVEDCAPGTAEPVAGGLPDVTLPCLGGGPDVDLAALRGPMVVNLWASWCGPVPRGDAGPAGSSTSSTATGCAVLGIDYQDAADRRRDGAGRATAGVTYPLLADPQRRPERPRRRSRADAGCRSSRFVDADGTVVHQESGGDRVRAASSSTWSSEHLGVRAVTPTSPTGCARSRPARADDHRRRPDPLPAARGRRRRAAARC